MSKQDTSYESFISKESLSGFLLFGVTLLALIIANSSFSQMYYDFWQLPLGINLGDAQAYMTLKYWVNDALMALFFLMVGLEIKRELLVGELSTKEQAAFPVIAALGGMIIPALFYVILNLDNVRGFGIPMATDIAFALGILMVLGKRVNPSLKIFLVALAVVDDLGAVSVVAIFYTENMNYNYFAYVGLIYAIMWILNMRGVKALWIYLLLGFLLWILVHFTGVHATIAGVLVAFVVPIKSKIRERRFISASHKLIQSFEQNIDKIPILNDKQIDALENMRSHYHKVQNPLVKLENRLHNISAFIIMPIFAFANAGVAINLGVLQTNMMVVLGIIFGLLIGKPIGIFLFTYIFHKLKIIKKPDSIEWGEIIGAGFIAGIGFTMSIFIAGLAFYDYNVIDAAKVGIFIASFLSAIIGVILLLNPSFINRLLHKQV